jgi:hypothetical protein
MNLQEQISRIKSMIIVLNESKQVGLLYHYTSKTGLENILKTNKLNTSEEFYRGHQLNYISFTRNKNFHKRNTTWQVKTDYRITLDGDKLSNKYKIKPFAYMPGWNYENSWEYDWLENEPENVVRDFLIKLADYDEQEERIYFKNIDDGIDNISKYIISIDNIKN